MAKKLLLIALASLLAFGIVGCGEGDDEEAETPAAAGQADND